jgi:hypothetical protein
MVGPAYKGVFITRYEAIRNFIGATVVYLVLVFRRELYYLSAGVSENEVFWIGSPELTTAHATILYLIFLIFWSWSVYDSVKNYRRKQRNLKMLLEEQAEWRKNGGEF